MSTKPPGRRSRGSSVSSKQLAYGTLKGHMAEFTTPVGVVQGYLCGMDDFHWLVVTPEVDIILVHKAQATLVNTHFKPLGIESPYASEPRYEELEQIVGPFRRYV